MTADKTEWGITTCGDNQFYYCRCYKPKDEKCPFEVQMEKKKADMEKRKKALSEYKWVQDMIDSLLAEPEEEQEQAVLDFLRKKARELEDGSGQDKTIE